MRPPHLLETTSSYVRCWERVSLLPSVRMQEEGGELLNSGTASKSTAIDQ